MRRNIIIGRSAAALLGLALLFSLVGCHRLETLVGIGVKPLPITKESPIFVQGGSIDLKANPNYAPGNEQTCPDGTGDICAITDNSTVLTFQGVVDINGNVATPPTLTPPWRVRIANRDFANNGQGDDTKDYDEALIICSDATSGVPHCPATGTGPYSTTQIFIRPRGGVAFLPFAGQDFNFTDTLCKDGTNPAPPSGEHTFCDHLGSITVENPIGTTKIKYYCGGHGSKIAVGACTVGFGKQN